MKNKISNTSKNNGIDGQFRSLNNNEMINLKGGAANPIPPIPPSGGADFPLSVSNIQNMPVLVVSVSANMPAATSPTAVALS